MNEKGGIISPYINYIRADVYGEITYIYNGDMAYEPFSYEESELDEFRDVNPSINLWR